MRHLILLISLLLSTTLFGQHLTDQYLSLDIGFGPRNLVTTPGMYNLAFDTNLESHSFDTELTDQLDLFGIKLGLTGGKYKGFNHQLYFDLPFGKRGSGKAGYSLGYGFAFEVDKFDILLRPAVGVSNGGTNIIIGSFKVDTISQFILDQEFNDETVKIDLEKRTTFFVPEFKATFLIAQKIGVFVSVAYDVPLNDKIHSLKFKGAETKSVDLGDPNIRFTQTTQPFSIPITDNIFKPGGLRISFGVSTYTNKQLYD